MDELLAKLAARSRIVLGAADDFNIIVTGVHYPIGTLMRQGSSIPVNDKACLPSQDPTKRDTPNLFENYQISKSIAVTFGVDNAVFTKLADLGLNLNDSDTVSLAFKQQGAQLLADDDVAGIVKKADCEHAISSRAVWLVRGYIVAQRDFTVKNDKGGDLKFKGVKIANFDINANPGSSSLQITDDGEVGFLQVVSQVKIANTAGLSLAYIKRQAPTTRGKVWVQRDTRDQTHTDQKLLRDLKAIPLNVEPTVEAIDSKKMPTSAQVRYFNVDDESLANTALN